jgi:branched-chain amino acid transport system ATP-binding protein
LPESLVVRSLSSGYGKRQVLYGIDLSVCRGEVLAIIGHNGAGKSTLLKAVFGLLPIWSGQVALNGRVLDRLEPRQLLGMGMTYAPQGNRVFTELSVEENLEIAGTAVGARDRTASGIERVLRIFPTLKARIRQRAGTLSGGEKQMLALANALMLDPQVLLLDEPSLGLAPGLARRALAHIRTISDATGMSVVLVEQKVREALRIAERVCVLRGGRISYAGPAEELRMDEAKLRQVYL